jgi:hypothetical protein
MDIRSLCWRTVSLSGPIGIVRFLKLDGSGKVINVEDAVLDGSTMAMVDVGEVDVIVRLFAAGKVTIATTETRFPLGL